LSYRPFHHQRPLTAAALAYGAGVWAGVRFPYRPGIMLAGMLISMGMALLLPRLGRRRIAGVLCACLFLGMLLSGHAFHPSLPPTGAYQVDGVVAEDVEIRSDGSAAGYLERVTVSGDEGEYRLRRVYWTYTPDDEKPFVPLDGQRVRFFANLYHPSGQTNPYGFDFRLFLLQKGAVAGVSGAREAETVSYPGRGLSSLLYRVRNELSGKMTAIFGEGNALPQAMLLGVREHLPQEVQDSFSDAGIAHVLAVSGLHVGLMAGVLQMLLRRWISPKKQLLVMTVFLTLYCGLLNFAAPVVRASLLLMILGLQKLVRRASDPLTCLSAAFLVLLIFRPLDLFSASFQLSFGAVLSMVLFRRGIEKRLGFLPFSSVRSAVAATLSATAGTILPTIQVFHRFSLIGLAINPVICGLFGIVLPVYGLVFLVGCVYQPLGMLMAAGVNGCMHWLLKGIEWAADLPFATLRVPALPWYLMVALAFSGLCCSRYLLLSRRLRAVLSIGAMLCAAFAWGYGSCRDVQYLQLEAGQADSALILDGQKTILIDAGEYGGDLADYLLSTGRQADYVILTHLHTDHCLGLRELMKENIPIGTVLIPERGMEMQIDQACLDMMAALEARGVSIQGWHAGDGLQTDRVRIEALWPIAGTVRPGQDANCYPLVLYCDLDGVGLYSAADLLGEFEHYAARDADILKVAHHGSKTSTGDAFLSCVTPQLALITGRGGAASLPHVDTLQRLEKAGACIYNTGDWGALHIRIRDGQAHLTPYLNYMEEP